MGRDVYFMRLAYGRSSHDPPIPHQPSQSQDAGEDSSTQPPADIVPERNECGPNSTTEEASPLYSAPEQQYNSRGHPVNPQSRAYGRSIRAAANDVLSVVGVVERKGSDGHSNSQSRRRSESLTNENSAGTLIGTLTELGLEAATWWCGCTLRRLLAYPSAADLPFTQLISQRYNESGALAFFFTGSPSICVGAIVGHFGWWGPQGVILYYLDRLVIAVVSSKNVRDGYNSLRPYISGLILTIFTRLSVLGTLLALPLNLLADLQVLDLAWRGRLLPPWRSLIPFSSASPLSFGNTPLATLMYLFYNPLIWRMERLVAETLDVPARAGPVSRRSSAQRRHSSIASRISAQPSRGNSDSLWKRVSTSVANGWTAFLSRLPGYSTSTAEQCGQLSVSPEPLSLEAPETFIPRNASPDPAASFRDASIQITPNDLLNLTVPPPEDATPIDENVNAHLQIPNQDATIRISSIDSVSGTVNLEIGLPEDHPSFEPNLPFDDSEPRSRRSSVATNDRIMLSDLAYEPTNFFVILNARWLTNFAVLPFEAILYRLLAVHFMAHPWPGRSGGIAGLRSLVGRNGAFGVYRQMGLGGYANWMGKVGLCFMCDIAIGCGFWLVECGIIKFVGRRWFAWGNVKESEK